MNDLIMNQQHAPSSSKSSARCGVINELHSNENLRRVKLRAVEFIRDYLDTQLIKLNRICLNCIDGHVRDAADQSHRAVIFNSQALDIDYISDAVELTLTLQYLDRNQVPSVRITSRFLSITTVEQVIDYLIQTFDLPFAADNLRLTMIRRENDEIWTPILYDRSSTMYQLDIQSNSYLRFEFNLEARRNLK